MLHVWTALQRLRRNSAATLLFTRLHPTLEAWTPPPHLPCARPLPAGLRCPTKTIAFTSECRARPPTKRSRTSGHVEPSGTNSADARTLSRSSRVSDVPHKDRDDPVSLAPLTPEEALRALLAVDPADPPVDDETAGVEDEDRHKQSS